MNQQGQDLLCHLEQKVLVVRRRERWTQGATWQPMVRKCNLIRSVMSLRMGVLDTRAPMGVGVDVVSGMFWSLKKPGSVESLFLHGFRVCTSSELSCESYEGSMNWICSHIMPSSRKNLMVKKPQTYNTSQVVNRKSIGHVIRPTDYQFLPQWSFSLPFGRLIWIWKITICLKKETIGNKNRR